MLEYITFTNVILALLIPVYIGFIVYFLSYAISYGISKGIYHWKRDFELFMDMMEEEAYQKEIARSMDAVKVENPTIQ